MTDLRRRLARDRTRAMTRLRRSSFRTDGVAGLEQVGHDFHAKTLPLPEHSHRGTEICYLASGEVVWLLGGGCGWSAG